jgi:hypothetical protein
MISTTRIDNLEDEEYPPHQAPVLAPGANTTLKITWLTHRKGEPTQGCV